MTSTPSKKRQKNQSDRFTDAARALECDKSEERFDAALRKVATDKPTGGTVVAERVMKSAEK